jgi:hypothetical protein
MLLEETVALHVASESVVCWTTVVNYLRLELSLYFFLAVCNDPIMDCDEAAAAAPNGGGGGGPVFDATERRSSLSTCGSARFESFTEAVPLSLSSMAHASVPLDDGVLDGIKQVLQHTLLQCVNYAKIRHPSPNHHLWTFRDLSTANSCWTPMKEPAPQPLEFPLGLEKMKFCHSYSRNALIYLSSSAAATTTSGSFTAATAAHQQQFDDSNTLTLDHIHHWQQHPRVLGRISLFYTSTEPLTQGELDGTDTDNDMPACVLYKVMVEYRSLPATGNQQAVLAEELSMLSFGGSIDDDVKYGALAALYDPHAKYVLEIYSVRGKKYKFDLMDSTLGNGSIPTLSSGREADPCVKSLCVTVTNHRNEQTQQRQHKGDLAASTNGSKDGAIAVDIGGAIAVDTEPNGANKEPSTGSNQADAKTYAVTRMSLLLEGKPRKENDFSDLPSLDYIPNGIMASFLLLNPNPPAMVTSMPSGHTLLLDEAMAGRIYINGRYVTTWGQDPRIGSHGVALFGMDLHSIAVWHGRIVDYESLKTTYALLWHELLVDARVAEYNIASKLLHRLMRGKDPNDDMEDDDLYDDEYDQDESDINVTVDCLESQVLTDAKYDRVGIAPKALATKYGAIFGKDAFPCLPHEVEWLKSTVPGRRPVITPQRLINILRRGGYFDAQFTSNEFWFSETRPPEEGTEMKLVQAAIELLEQAGCDDVAVEQIGFTTSAIGDNYASKNFVCRYSEAAEQYSIHERFLSTPVGDYIGNNTDLTNLDADKVKAFMLGMYIAREHPDGRVLPRYMLRAKPGTLEKS